MKKAFRLLSMILIVSMLLSISAYAAPGKAGRLPLSKGDRAKADETAEAADPKEADPGEDPVPVPVGEDSKAGPDDEEETGEDDPLSPSAPSAPSDISAAATVQADRFPPSEYTSLTGYGEPDGSDPIYVGHDVTEPEEITLDVSVDGEGYTAVYAHGAGADASVTGTLTVTGQGEGASELSGQGAALVAHDGASLSLVNAAVDVSGTDRAGLVISDGALATVSDSQLTVSGGSAVRMGRLPR